MNGSNVQRNDIIILVEEVMESEALGRVIKRTAFLLYHGQCDSHRRWFDMPLLDTDLDAFVPEPI